MNRHQAYPLNIKPPTGLMHRQLMHSTRRSNPAWRRSCWLAILLVITFSSPVQSGDQHSPGIRAEAQAGARIRIFDEYGQLAQSGRRPSGGEIFDVAVGPPGHKIRFVPDTLTISVGDTVRWTWGSDEHSVTSGTPCTADGQYFYPDNNNCDAGILSDTGFVYEHTFTQAGTYTYFCALHCFAGMTGTVTVTPKQRTSPTPRPRPTPHPRPVPPQ